MTTVCSHLSEERETWSELLSPYGCSTNVFDAHSFHPRPVQLVTSRQMHALVKRES